jgi:hypothetical protein
MPTPTFGGEIARANAPRPGGHYGLDEGHERMVSDFFGELDVRALHYGQTRQTRAFPCGSRVNSREGASAFSEGPVPSRAAARGHAAGLGHAAQTRRRLCRQRSLLAP